MSTFKVKLAVFQQQYVIGVRIYWIYCYLCLIISSMSLSSLYCLRKA